jgi:hypothetical protein
MELTRLSKDENALLEAFSEGKSDAVEIVLPDTMAAKEVVRYADSAAKMLRRNVAEKAIWIAALGRLHFLARSRTDVLAAAKCLTIGEFEERLGLTSGDSRSSIWAASRAYAEMPGLTPMEYATIGSTRLAIAAKECKGKSESQKAKILEKAREKDGTVEEFRNWVEQESGTSAPGETRLSAFSLVGSLADIKTLREYLADPRFIAFCEGETRPLSMILAAIAESSSEWPTVTNPASEEILDADYEDVPTVTDIEETVAELTPMSEAGLDW